MTDLRIRSVRHFPIVRVVGTFYTDTPTRESPVIDDRAAGKETVYVGTFPGQRVWLEVQRIAVDAAVPLQVTATGPGVRIEEPANGLLSSTSGDDVGFLAVSAGETDIEIRVPGGTGAPIYVLRVRVYPLKRIRVATWLVRTDGLLQHGSPPADPGFAAAFEIINAIWAPAGIEFVLESHPEIHHVMAPAPDKLPLSKIGELNPAETVLAGAENGVARTENAINVYLVKGFDRADEETGAITFDQAATRPTTYRYQHGGEEHTAAAAPRAAHTGIIVASAPGGPEHIARTLAHELGHFLSLRHPYTPGGSAGRREDPKHAASGMFLMHWVAPGGCLIPLKRLGGTSVLVDDGADEARGSADSQALVIP